MQTTISPARSTRRPSFLPGILAGAALLLAILAWHHLASSSMPRQHKMEKSSGRNGKHANRNAREKAAQEYEKAKAEYEKLKSKPGKSKEDAALRDKLKEVMEHWRKKKDWKGENHAQKAKGN
jgi:hypothetical protein